jgi:flavin reductase (DIM6/NTAB) family NADH-FMN oxidoreductase RutF/DNA-binding MarR family transcriptional regulator
MGNFEPGEFRQALGTFATGVTVVTASSGNGELAGVTANSFTSVSLEPPLVLWCLASSSDNLQIFQSARYFAVNILASDQETVSSHFAKRQENKFDNISYQPGLGGAPLLENCMTRLQCRTKEKYEAGDHWIFLGEVEKFDTTSREALLFHLGSYATSLPLPSDESSVIGSIKTPETHDDSLFSLLLQGIHAYQEKFESRQKKIIESNYEARILTILHKYTQLDIDGICQMIQMPKSDTGIVLKDLNNKGLIRFDGNHENEKVSLTASGLRKSEELFDLAKQHDVDVYSLFQNCDADAFRDNLQRIISWAQDN